MKTINLTDEQYNNLTSLISKEALDILNNTSNSSNESINSRTLIRCLSETEYKKYIINGTADGAITASDINVWHYPPYIESTGWYFRVDSASYDGSTLCNGLTIYQVGYNNIFTCRANKYIVELQHGSRENHSKSSIIYYTLLLDNTQNQHKAINHQDYIFEAIGGYSQYRDRIYIAGTYEVPKIISIPKTDTSMHGAAVGYSYAWNTTSVTYDVYCSSCFRPVFQYKDNNKSTNTYY
jgi:hypothetical protein